MAGAAGQLVGNGEKEPFKAHYRCYSISMYPYDYKDCQEKEKGGKIFLPPSALKDLMRLEVDFPMLFKLTNLYDARSTHCGVLEFTADEGRMYIPYWMMRNIMIEQGEMIRVELATLPVANFSKLQPQSADFMEISNPKAVLEIVLREFACLTAGDMIAIQYNDRTYEIRVLETGPADAVNIIECDMNVDIIKPMEREATPKEETAEPKSALDLDESFASFLGSGHRLGGKSEDSVEPQAEKDGNSRRGAPDRDLAA